VNVLPYALIVPLALLWLVVQHARSPDVSARSKRWVVGLTAATFVVPWLWMRALMAAAILQFGLCVFLAILRMVNAPGAATQNLPGAPPAKPSGPGKSSPPS